MRELLAYDMWRQAWAAFKRNWLTGIGISIVAYLVLILPYFLLKPPSNPVMSFFLSVGFLPLFEIIYARWSLQAIDSGGKVSFGSALSFRGRFTLDNMRLFNTRSSQLIYFWIIPFVFLLLLFTFGVIDKKPDISDASFWHFYFIYVFLLYVSFFYPYLVLDRIFDNLDVPGVFLFLFSKDLNIRTGMPIILFILVLSINGIGASIPFRLGLLVTVPFTYLFGAALYRAMSPREEPSQAEEDKPAFEWTATPTPAEGEAPPPPSESSK